MTSWVREPGSGRDRGPRGVLRAWIEVIVRPRRFFEHGIAPGDQAGGLTFLLAIVAIEETSRLVLVPDAVPDLVGGRLVSMALVVGLATFLVAPLALHAVGAAQVLMLRPLVAERAGVSQTIQVLAYATAPGVIAGVPVPAVRVLCAGYGSVLLIVGLATVHDASYKRAAAAGALPAALVFGYGFRGFSALVELLAAWYII